MMLQVNQVTKKYNNFVALEEINLEFNNGVYALLAPNGAGKTTLIKMLTTLLFPTKGEILWEGDEIQGLDEKYREIIGYLPQKFGYYKNNTPRQFLSYLAALKGMEKGQAKEEIRELLIEVGLEDVMDQKMRKFSGGMIQRVGIAQALLNHPKIIILDEPTAGLDPKERVRFRNMISRLSENRIVILSTHIVSDIETIANQVIMIKDRRLFSHDTPKNTCDMLAGKVYETWEIEKLDIPHILLTQRQEGAQTLVRFVAEKEYQGDAKLVEPTLEDVFLYVYNDGV